MDEELPVHESESRYDGARVLRVENSLGTEVLVLHTPEYLSAPWTFSYVVHRVVEGDRLDLLAARYLGDSTLWWLIARANPEVFFPADLEPGDEIRIPHA